MLNQRNLVELGSRTARRGFRNERDVIDRFNNWEKDKDARAWLGKMGYKISDIEYVKASKVVGQYKADVQVRVRIVIKLKSQEDLQNLQVKLVSNPRGYNQIDKRWVDKYAKLWNMPQDVVKVLKFFTGEVKPNKNKLRDPRRMFFDEMRAEEQEKILNFFKNNKILIISDILKGRGEFSADWVLVILRTSNGGDWVLKSINEAMNVFGKGDVIITERGSMRIGKITVQRKGGDAGRETANMLQFKINPVELFGN